MDRALTPTRVQPWAGDFSFAYLRRLLATAQATCDLRLLGDGLGTRGPRPRLFVRHDIDLSLERALAMAEVEAGLDIAATFFVMVDSPLYDLEEATSRELLFRLRALGHEVGLHLDLGERGGHPDISLAEILGRLADDRARLESVLGEPLRSLSFHRPPDALVGRLEGSQHLDGLVNAYAEPLMGCYLADSAGSWRHGDPLPIVAEPPADVIQLLIHPFWWHDQHVTPGDRLEAFFRARTAGRSPEAIEAFDRALSGVVRRARRSGAPE